MSNEKFDNDMPKIVLEKEDREAFQRTRQNGNGKSTSAAVSEDKPQVKSGASTFLVFLVFIIAAGAAGASYWLYEQKRIQDEIIAKAEDRILDLERRLSATGEEMDQSAVALQVKVTELSERTDTLWNEMDKLWASAWRKNQAEIKAMDKKVDVQGRNLANQMASLQSDVISSTTNMAVLQEQVDSANSSRSELARTLQEVALSSNGLKQDLTDLQAKLTAIETVNNDVSRRVSELEKWRRTIPKPKRPEAPSVGGTPPPATSGN